MKTKALVMFSGGLDSMLAVKILQSQDIEVEGVCFTSAFFGAGNAKRSAEALGIKLTPVDVSREMVDLVKNPPSGYGKNMNPCIDCHAMMARIAGEIAKSNKFSLVATGEVLGQRPFSQNKDALNRVSRLAGIEILRPLSAKLLDETDAEKNGIVNRGRLSDIQGRSRERQMELADKFKIKEYPTPAGGCLLTDPAYSERLLKLFDNWPGFDANDAILIKNGRIFWQTYGPEGKNGKILIVVGRNDSENEKLVSLARKGDIMVELKKENGPTTVVRQFGVGNWKPIESDSITVEIPNKLKLNEIFPPNEKPENMFASFARLTGYYAVKARGTSQDFIIKFCQ
jgi:tRNA-uridine 2-sulfurtransferase